MNLLELAEDYNVMRNMDGEVTRASIILNGEAYRKITHALDNSTLALADIRINRLVDDKQDLLFALKLAIDAMNQLQVLPATVARLQAYVKRAEEN